MKNKQYGLYIILPFYIILSLVTNLWEYYSEIRTAMIMTALLLILVTLTIISLKLIKKYYTKTLSIGWGLWSTIPVALITIYSYFNNLSGRSAARHFLNFFPWYFATWILVVPGIYGMVQLITIGHIVSKSKINKEKIIKN